MKATIQIPAGWRRVTRGNVQKGDMCFYVVCGSFSSMADLQWMDCPDSDFGRSIKEFHLVIRRVAAKGAKK